MALSSAERVHAALRLQQPDRVPVLEFVIDPKVARAAVSGCRDAADCMDRLGMDGVGCGACFEAVRENSDGSFVDEWGVVYRRNAEAVHHPIAGPIKTLKDARAYVPPGIDATFIGFYDLSASMGIPGQTDHVDVRNAQQTIVEACARHGVPSGIHVVKIDSAELRRRRQQGFRFIACGIDTGFLIAGCRAFLQEVNQA